MQIKTSEFVKSSQTISFCPKDGKPEFAFIGRSNVGKSSLINMLVNKGGLAKTSSTPGKTRLINHFLINSNWYLVDLPGYGFARLSKDKREAFNKATLNYLAKRESLYAVFVLVDVRHKPQSLDIQFINWLGKNEIPMAIIFTKSDKISIAETNKNIRHFCDTLNETWELLPPWFVSSSKKAVGRDEILDFIEQSMTHTDNPE